MPIAFIIFVFAIGFLFALVQIGLFTIVFEKLGLSTNSAFLLLLTSLAFSLINIPLFRIEAQASEPQQLPWYLRRLSRQPAPVFQGYTTIAVNAGGCLIPLSFSLYLFFYHSLPLFDTLLAIVGVTLISYLVSRPIHGIGIGMPVFIAPLTAALAAILINQELSAPLAYIGGTTGVLIGADLMRLRDIRTMGAPVAAIGGAGTFDGIFITGMVAVILA